MTVYLSQIPGDLPITMVDGNDLSFKLNWATDTSAYTFTAWIQPFGSSTAIIPMPMTIIDATLGLYTCSVSKTSIANIPLNKEHKWRMDRTTVSSGLVRTVLSGTFTVLDE